MIRCMKRAPALVLMSVLTATAGAQVPAPLPNGEFDVVSIKRNTSGETGGSIRSLDDGTTVVVNQPMESLIRGASPVPVRDVEGMPDWMQRERYDVTTKPPAGSTREQRALMMRRMFEERMNLKAHVEQRERDTFALVLARSDGRLGPQLEPSPLDCTPRPPGTPPPPPPATPPTPFSPDEALARCGGLFGQGLIVSGGITMDSLVLSLGGLAGRLVNNRTGLKGFYALKLQHAPPGAPPPDDNLPDFFTALQEQLGLKLQPEKSTVPVLVIDSIERPTEN
jgi:uncharacterized protein (TIGR03435 family)